MQERAENIPPLHLPRPRRRNGDVCLFGLQTCHRLEDVHVKICITLSAARQNVPISGARYERPSEWARLLISYAIVN